MDFRIAFITIYWRKLKNLFRLRKYVHTQFYRYILYYVLLQKKIIFRKILTIIAQYPSILGFIKRKWRDAVVADVETDVLIVSKAAHIFYTEIY